MSRRKPLSELEATAVVVRWNSEHPVGTQVTYWPGAVRGDGKEGATRSEAWVLHRTPVVMVTGLAGCLALSHVEVRS